MGNTPSVESNGKPALDQEDVVQPEAPAGSILAHLIAEQDQALASAPVDLNQSSGIDQSQVISRRKAEGLVRMMREGAAPEAIEAFLAEPEGSAAAAMQGIAPEVTVSPVAGLSIDKINELKDRYAITVIDELGRGGSARIYVIENENFRPPEEDALTPRHALKMLSPIANEKVRSRFELEIQSIHYGCDHPSVITPHSVGQLADGTLFYTMPIMGGGSLNESLSRSDQDPVFRKRALEGMAGVLDGLDHLHNEIHIVHRDIKPGNLLLSAGTLNETGPLKIHIADLGIVKQLATDEEVSESTAGAVVENLLLTGDGAILGTPHYMSPEQAQGSAALDGRSDQYAVGVILFRLATGDFPHSGRTGLEILSRTVSNPAPDPLAIDATLDPALAQVISRMIAKNPEDRFASAGEAAVALRAALSNLPEDGNFKAR